MNLISLPGFENNFDMMLKLIEVRNQKNWIHDDIIIDSVYGSLPQSPWNGGRSLSGYMTLEEAYYKVDTLKEAGINFKLLATNYFIDEQTVYDSDSLQFLYHVSKNPENFIVVSKDFMNKFILQKYKTMQRELSITTTLFLSDSELKESLINFDRVVLPLNLNKKEELLDSNTIEVIVNSSCVPTCKLSKLHYTEQSIKSAKLSLKKELKDDYEKYRKVVVKDEWVGCPLHSLDPNLPLSRMNHDDILKSKYKYFKIAGRVQPRDSLLKDIASIVIKEEYQKDFLSYMIL